MPIVVTPDTARELLDLRSAARDAAIHAQRHAEYIARLKVDGQPDDSATFAAMNARDEAWQLASKLAVFEAMVMPANVVAVETTPLIIATPAEQAKHRIGRMGKNESNDRQNRLLVLLRDAPALKNNQEYLANTLGVSLSTIYRWIGKYKDKYKDSITAQVDPDEDADDEKD